MIAFTDKPYTGKIQIFLKQKFIVKKSLLFYPLFVTSTVKVNCDGIIIIYLRASHFLSDMNILGTYSSTLEF